MKYPVLSAFLLIFTLTVSGCGKAPAASAANASVEDKASLISALESAKATVETGDPVSQAFFSPEGSIIKVNGADVQIFEYPNAEAMENEATQVASDGGSIGTNMVMWMDAPHFYKSGRIIVLYVGSDEAVLSLFEQVLGPQFAGR